MINTMGWVEGLGFQLLMHTIVAMRANIVLVVGQDRLLKQLQATYQVLFLPSSKVHNRACQVHCTNSKICTSASLHA